MAPGRLDRDDVPDIRVSDVCGDEVQLIPSIQHSAVPGDVAPVRVTTFVHGAFDLDAEEASVVLDGEVVASHVSPGLGDAESVLGGAGHEAEFGPFAPELGVLDIDTLVCHFCLGFGKVNGRGRRQSGLVQMKNAAFLGPRLVSYLICSYYIAWQWGTMTWF